MLKFKKETEFRKTEIGDVPRDWEVKRLKEVAHINKKIGKSNNFDGKFCFISMEDIPTDGKFPFFKEVDYSDIKSGIEVFPGQILLAKITPSFEHGKMCVVPEIGGKWFATTEVFTIFPKNENMDTRWYLYYTLKEKNLRDILEGSMTGTSGRQRVQLSALKSLSIPYPPLPEQSRIAAVLSWFDDLIENKKRQNEILEKTAMAIFKSWFVDFEPFKDGEFVYSEELGKKIPKGWEVKAIGEVVSTQYGFTASSEEIGEIKLLRIMDINKTFVIDWDSVPFCSIDNKIFLKYQLMDKDIVISRIGDIGKIAIIEDPPPSVFASYLIRLKIKYEKLTPYYLYYWLIGPDYQEYIQGAAEGSTRPNTNAEVIKAGAILLPPKHIIDKFENMASSIRQKIIFNQKEIMVLRKVRDVLLPQLVFGKLRVVEI